MKRILKILLILILPFAFSSCNQEETPTEQNEILLTHISCLDQNNNEINSIDYVIDQTEYIYKNVKVYAYYSDGSSGDITPFVTFSDVDLTTVGEKKVEVSYKGCVDSFLINITKIEVKRIEIDTTNVKKIYTLNDWLDLSELKVYKSLSNSNFVELNDYEVVITHSNGNELDNRQLIYPGLYQVLISYQGKYSIFDVYAYENTFDYMISSDINKIEFNEDGIYNFKNNEIISSSENYELSAYNGVAVNKFINNNPVEYIFADYFFEYTYDLVEDSSLILDVKSDFEIVLIIDENDYLSIYDSNNNIINHYSYKFGDDIFVCFSGINGLYNITSLGKSKIKAMAINILGFVPYEEIIVDTAYAKTSFSVNDTFTYEGLKLYYKFNEATTENIDINTCDIILTFNDNIVSSLSTSGVYKVLIKFQDVNGSQIELNYSIVVNSIDNINELELDLTNVKLDFKNDDIFSTEGIKIYHVTNDSRIEINVTDCDIKLFYNDGKSTYIVSNFVVIPGSYYVEILYNNGSVSLIKTYDITYDSGALIYDFSAEVTITSLNESSIEIKIANYVESIVDFNILLFEDNKLLNSISTFTFIVSNIDSNKKYEIKGYYTGKINDQLYIIYIDKVF